MPSRGIGSADTTHSMVGGPLSIVSYRITVRKASKYKVQAKYWLLGAGKQAISPNTLLYAGGLYVLRSEPLQSGRKPGTCLHRNITTRGWCRGSYRVSVHLSFATGFARDTDCTLISSSKANGVILPHKGSGSTLLLL